MIICVFVNLLLFIKSFFLSGGTLITPLPMIFFIATSPTDVRAPVARGAMILGNIFVAAGIKVLVINPARAPKKPPF